MSTDSPEADQQPWQYSGDDTPIGTKIESKSRVIQWINNLPGKPLSTEQVSHLVANGVWSPEALLHVKVQELTEIGVPKYAARVFVANARESFGRPGAVYDDPDTNEVADAISNVDHLLSKVQSQLRTQSAPSSRSSPSNTNSEVHAQHAHDTAGHTPCERASHASVPTEQTAQDFSPSQPPWFY